MRDVGPSPRQAAHFFIIKMNAVSQHHVRPRDSQRVKIRYVAQAALALDNLAFALACANKTAEATKPWGATIEFGISLNLTLVNIGRWVALSDCLF